MRVLISHPFFWPYYRRGAERYIFELSCFLAHNGHNAEIITSKPGSSKTIIKEGIKVHYKREFRNPLLYRYGITPESSFALHAFYPFLERKYDLIHSLFYSDGVAAGLCSKFKNIQYILTYAGVPIASFFKKYRIHNYLMNKAFSAASAIIVFSEFARNHLWEGYKREGVVIPGTVDISQFYIEQKKDFDRPKILCTASMIVPYKNVALLIEAFDILKKKIPKAVLQLSGEVDTATAKRLLNSVSSKTRDSIDILGVGKVHDLPQLYAEAAITVLPSINEAFGFVLLESLASGTPVVGTESGGIPEFINDSRIGILYKPNRTDTLPTNAGDLCDAMYEAIELAKNSKTPHFCRQHASHYDWSVIGPKIEEVYKNVIY